MLRLLRLLRLLTPFQISQVRTAYAGIPVRTRVEGLSGMSDDADDPHAAWREWHERRAAAVSAPEGTLALTGTFRLADYPEGRIPAVPGRWRATAAGAVLTATPEDSCRLDGEPFTGEVLLDADEGSPAHARLCADGLRIVVIRGEGEWGVRVQDPASGARRARTGVEATPFDPAFVLQGAEHTPQVAVDPDDGSLWAVLGDATAGLSSHRRRFLKPGIPDARGSITVDSTVPRCLPAPSRTTASVLSRRPGTRCRSRSRRASGG